MTDAELIARFEDATLAPGEFGHVQHLRVAWIYLEQFGHDGALERMTRGLRGVVARLGAPDKFDAGLTRAWLDAIDAARAANPGVRSFEALLASCPHLLDRSAIPLKR